MKILKGPFKAALFCSFLAIVISAHVISPDKWLSAFLFVALAAVWGKGAAKIMKLLNEECDDGSISDGEATLAVLLMLIFGVLFFILMTVLLIYSVIYGD